MYTKQKDSLCTETGIFVRRKTIRTRNIQYQVPGTAERHHVRIIRTLYRIQQYVPGQTHASPRRHETIAINY